MSKVEQRRYFRQVLESKQKKQVQFDLSEDEQQQPGPKMYP